MCSLITTRWASVVFFSRPRPGPRACAKLTTDHVACTACCCEPPQEIASFEGYAAPLWRLLLWYLLAACTLGFSLLVAKWYPGLYTRCCLQPCHLRDATHVRIKVRHKPRCHRPCALAAAAGTC